MDNVIAFTPRQRPPEPEAPAPLAGLALRAHLEGAAQTALDAADRIIAALDRIEGADDAEAAPMPPAQVVRLGDLGSFATSIARTRPQAREEAPAPALPDPEPTTPPEAPQPEPEPEPIAAPEIRAVFLPLPWGGAGNVVSAAGCAILALVARA